MGTAWLSRRRFLGLSALGAAGTLLGAGGKAAEAMMSGGGGMGGGGMGGGGTTVINPPPGAAFKDPAVAVNMSSTPGIVEVSIEAREAQVKVNGATATLQTYNGLYPGPTINVKRGDQLRVHMRNGLPYTTQKNILGHTKNITNLHTHGLHVSPEEPADSMMVQLAPGGTYDYIYDLDLEEPGHANLYHPHVHGLTPEQDWSGLMGAIVVQDDLAALAGYETHTLILKDISLSGSAPAPYTSMMEYMQGKEGDTVMVNGQVNPVLNIRPGQVQRWRIINGSQARFYNLGIEKHVMQLVGTDGGLLDRPYQLNSILLSPGERIDILVKASATKGAYKFLSLPYNRGGSCKLQQITLLTMNCTGAPASDTLPREVNPAAARIQMDTSTLKKNRIDLSMMGGAGYINGQTFVDMDHCYELMSMLDTYEVWEIVNSTGMDHPFHQHVNSAQVLSITGGDANYAALYTTIPAMKDVVIVPKWGSIQLLMPVKDWPGMAMFHCHILEHEDIGMMAAWHIMM